MLKYLRMDKNNLDELFEAAKELIDSRHSIMEYSPTNDIIYLYETISFYSYAASIECMLAKAISLLAQSAGVSFPGLGALLKYPTLIVNYYSMIVGINKISGIKVLNIDKENVANIIYDAGTEIIKYTCHVYQSKVKRISENNGNSVSISNIKRQIYKLIFFVGAYSDTISFGWSYLKTIEDLYKKKEVEIDVIRLKEKVIDKIKSLSYRLESVATYFSDKYVDNLTKEIGNSEEEVYNNLYNSMQDSIVFYNYIKNIECNELRSVIQKNATIHNSDTFIATDQLSTLVVELFNNPQSGYTAKNIYKFKEKLSVCDEMLCDMQKKYLSGVVSVSSNCINDIIILYSKYAAKDLELPPQNVFYENQAAYFALMPCPQSIEGIVNTLQKLINRRAGYTEFEISWLVSLWGQMIADITKSTAEKDAIETTLRTLSPYILTCILFYFASTDISRQIPYSFSDFTSLQTLFNRKYTNLSEILRYCPKYYHSLSLTDEYETEKVHKNLINFILTRYVGNLFYQYLHNKGEEDQLLNAFDSFDIISEIDKDIQKIARLIS